MNFDVHSLFFWWNLLVFDTFKGLFSACLGVGVTLLGYRLKSGCMGFIWLYFVGVWQQIASTDETQAPVGLHFKIKFVIQKRVYLFYFHVNLIF